MKKIMDFLNRWGVVIIMSFLFLILIKECSNGNRIKRFEKKQTEAVSKIETRVDSLSKHQVTDTDLRIEGLKAEKRMIQSCDRKKFDLDRENQIDREIAALEEKRK